MIRRKSIYACEDWKRVHDTSSRERCGVSAYWYVVSGPMYVCHNHKRHQEAQGEVCARLGGV